MVNCKLSLTKKESLPSSKDTTPITTTTIPDTTQPVSGSEEELLTGPDLVQPTEATSVEVISKYAYTHDVGALFYNMRISLDSNPTLTNGSSVDAVKISFTNNNATTDEYYVRLGYFLQQIEKNIIYQLKNSDEKNPSRIIKIDYNTDSNIILLYSRQLSANPNVCIFQRSYTLDDGSEIILFPNLNKFILDGYGNSNSPFYGKIMNAYFSMKDILTQMDSLKNADTGVLALIDLLKILTGGFCKSTGNYNRLEPTVDADTNTIKLIDIKTSRNGWNKYQKTDNLKSAQLVAYKNYFSQQFGVSKDNIEIEFFIVKRKIQEDSMFPQKRIQEFQLPQTFANAQIFVLTRRKHKSDSSCEAKSSSDPRRPCHSGRDFLVHSVQRPFGNVR